MTSLDLVLPVSGPESAPKALARPSSKSILHRSPLPRPDIFLPAFRRPRGLGDLPDELLVAVFEFLPPTMLGRVACVCRNLRRVATDELVWRGRYAAEFGPTAAAAADPTAAVMDGEIGRGEPWWKARFAASAGHVARWGTDGPPPTGTTLAGHQGSVTSLALAGGSGDRLRGDLRVVSTSDDATARVWDLSGGAVDCVAVLDGHHGAVWTVAVSGDGTVAATGGSDRTIRVWDLGVASDDGSGGDGQDRDGMRHHNNHNNNLNNDINNNNGHKARCAAILRGHLHWVSAVRLLQPHSDRTDPSLLSASYDGSIGVWGSGGARTAAIEVGAPVYALDAAPAGLLAGGGALTGTEAGAVDLWDLERQACVWHVGGGDGRSAASSAHAAPVYAVQVWGGFGGMSADKEGTVRLWDLRGRRAGLVLAGIGPLFGAQMHVDGIHCVVGTASGRVEIYDVRRATGDGTSSEGGREGGECHVRTLYGHTAKVFCVGVGRGGHVVAGSLDSTLTVWDLSS